MKVIYCVKDIIRWNEELILDDVAITCSTEELAEREVEKSINYLKKVKNEFGFGKCISEYCHRDGDGLYHLIFTYKDCIRLEYIWKIYDIELIES